MPKLYQLTVHFQDGDSQLCIRADSEQQAEAIGQELFPHCSLEAALRQLPQRGWIGQAEQQG